MCAGLPTFAANHPEHATKPHRDRAGTCFGQGLDVSVEGCLPTVLSRIVNLHHIKREAVAPASVTAATENEEAGAVCRVASVVGRDGHVGHEHPSVAGGGVACAALWIDGVCIL